MDAREFARDSAPLDFDSIHPVLCEFGNEHGSQMIQLAICSLNMQCMCRGQLVDEADMKTITSSSADRAPGRFIKGFIANLVLAGHRSIPPRAPKVRQGLCKVVELLDEQARSMLAEKASIESVRPWIDAGNQLRLSPTGGVENWERALRSAQLTFTKVGNPNYELVSFEIDRARAQSEVDHLDADFRIFVANAARAFLEKADLGA